jgi:DNA polymerase-3 subunit delta'
LLDIEKIYDSLPWLVEQRQQLADLVAADRCPHALLIQGRAGSGRRHLALWLATEMLGTDPSRALESDPDAEVGHPDFFTLEPEQDKQSIGVDQVRALIGFLNLTTHGRNGRVAVLYPADSMTINAANSLLKTLEEPPGKTLIILICESLKRLPATVISRCQRVRLPAPPTDAALAWLGGEVPDADLAAMLDFAGGAPLATLALHKADFAATANQYAADLKSLEQRQVSPVVIAERWAGRAKGSDKKQSEMALQWLYWRLSRRVRAGLEALSGKNSGETGGDSLQTGQIQLTVRACFRQMAQIRELRRLIKGGINAELNLAGLLMDWYGGLGHQ